MDLGSFCVTSSSGRIIVMLEGFWKETLRMGRLELERICNIINWATPPPQLWVHRLSTQDSLIVFNRMRCLWSYFKCQRYIYICILKILFRFTNGQGANYWDKMRKCRHRGLGILQLVPWSALTCGGLHGWAGDGGSILGYSAGVRFRGAGCWWGGWWVHQSPRFPLSKWMGKSLLPMMVTCLLIPLFPLIHPWNKNIFVDGTVFYLCFAHSILSKAIYTVDA